MAGESVLISPRSKMRQLAIRAAIVVGLFTWLFTGVYNARRFGEPSLLLEVFGLVTSIVNGIGWGLLVALILYAASFARSSTGQEAPYDTNRSRIWYLSAALVGALLGSLAPASAHAQEAVRPAPDNHSLVECRRLYAQSAYDKAINACNDATLVLVQQISRFRQLMQQKKTSAADLDFADTFCSQMLTITYTQALAENKLNEKEVGRQSALKAVGWVIFLYGILGERPDPSTKSRIASLHRDQATLERLYPGVSAEEAKAFKERLGGQ
jgi:hypothetical protein